MKFEFPRESCATHKTKRESWELQGEADFYMWFQEQARGGYIHKSHGPMCGARDRNFLGERMFRRFVKNNGKKGITMKIKLWKRSSSWCGFHMLNNEKKWRKKKLSRNDVYKCNQNQSKLCCCTMYARETQTIRMKLGECVRQTETLTPFFFALAKRTRRDERWCWGPRYIHVWIISLRRS